MYISIMFNLYQINIMDMNNSKDNLNIKTNEFIHLNDTKSVDNNNFLVSSDDLLIINEYIELIPNENIFFHSMHRFKNEAAYYNLYYTNYSRIIVIKNIKTKNHSIDYHKKFNYWLNDDQIMMIKIALKYSQQKINEQNNDSVIHTLIYCFSSIISLNKPIDYFLLNYEVSLLLNKEDIYFVPNEKIIIHCHESHHPENYEIYCTNYSRIFLIKSTINNKYFCSCISYNYHLNDNQIIILKNIVDSIHYFKIIHEDITIEMHSLIDVLLNSISENSNVTNDLDYKSKNSEYEKQIKLITDKNYELRTENIHLTDELNRVTQENKDLCEKLNIYAKIQSFKERRNKLKNEIQIIKNQLRDYY